MGLSLWCATAALAFDVQGHRGARGLGPENTLAGIERALAVGVSTIELDVVLSAEGVPVISHDTAPNPDITRDANGHWLQSRGPAFHTLTLAQIGEYDVGRINPATRYARDFPEQVPVDGERIPTLAALFELADRLRAGHVRFNIELKRNPERPQESPDPEAFVRAVVEVIRAHGMAGRSSLQSFDWSLLQSSQRIAPEIGLAFLTVQQPRSNNLASGVWSAGLRQRDFKDAPAMLAAAGAKLWSPNFNDLSRRLLERAREEGLRVVPWTVNEITDMGRLIDWGVDGLITDYPDRLRAVLERRGMALPPSVHAKQPAAEAHVAAPAGAPPPAPFGVAPDLK